MGFDYRKMLDEAIEKLPKDIQDKKRFEIPVVEIEIQGNKTLFKNFKEILSVLRRDSRHLSKYLFKELATPGNVQGSLLVLQRKVPQSMIQEKINDYVEEFVYCKECKKPDTKIIKEGRINFIRCEACGCRYPIRQI